MTLPISSRTRLFTLLGDPVSHSLSPTFQNAAIASARLDAVYTALRCAPADVPGLLLGVARAGGGGNVTVPHKELAASAVERPTEAVVDTGACNTFWLEDGVVCGDNTDIEGFERAVESLLGRSARGARVLLIGAGGVARAALYSLLRTEAAGVSILNRSAVNAQALAQRFPAGSTSIKVATAVSDVRGEIFDLVVNATTLGLRSLDPRPLRADFDLGGAAVLDLVYSPGETEWVRESRAKGARSADGLEMLLHQGAAAFERWWGISAPLEAMRSALPPR